MKFRKFAVVRRGECYEWQGARNSNGYGRVMVDGRKEYVHRIVYSLEYGDIPEGLEVLHRCDNPPCININHLFLGTQADNTRDASAKGRMSHPHFAARGEAHHNAKLTWPEVNEIRRLYKPWVCTASDLAQRFRVSVPTIKMIVRGQNWKGDLYAQSR